MHRVNFKPLLILAASIAAAAAHSQYIADFLPTPNGSGRAQAAGGGQIVGIAFGAGGGPALWDGLKHSYSVLSTAGFAGAETNGVGGGKQVGYGIANGHEHALMWSGPSTTPVSLHNSMFLGTIANGTDGKSQVGEAGVVPGLNVSNAVLWRGTPESAVNLHPAGYENSAARGVWDDVQVGGIAGPQGGGAVIWRGSAASMEFLPAPLGVQTAGAQGIFGSQVVGELLGGSSIVWDIDKWTFSLLGPGRAFATNGQHQVGYSGPAFEERALRWTGTEASRLDLHQFLPSGVVNSIATGIDENGTIVGWGHINGFGQVPIVWTPIPEPTGFLALGIGMLALCLRKRASR